VHFPTLIIDDTYSIICSIAASKLLINLFAITSSSGLGQQVWRSRLTAYFYSLNEPLIIRYNEPFLICQASSSWPLKQALFDALSEPQYRKNRGNPFNYGVGLPSQVPLINKPILIRHVR
jgi:hypothetical protein